MSEQPPTSLDDEPDDFGEVEDFDAWRSQQRAKRTGGRRVKVFGRVVALPTSLPLGLQLSLDDISNVDDVRRIVGILYGEDALDHWVECDVDMADFQTLMAWGMASADGQRITFDEAARLVAEATKEKAAAGKARAPKKAKKRKRGPGGGSPAAGR